MAAQDPARTTPVLREAWSELEERTEKERVEVERAARAAAVSRDDLHAAGLVTDFMHRTVDEALETARDLCTRVT